MRESPEVVACVDWIIFRRPDCPYPVRSHRFPRYMGAYAAAKAEHPDPGFPPLTQVSGHHGKPPRMFKYYYRNVEVLTPSGAPLWQPPTT